MVTEKVCDVVFSILLGFLDLLPDLEWTVNVSMVTGAVQWLHVVLYILPIGTVLAICGIIIAKTLFSNIIAMVKSIWELLPFL